MKRIHVATELVETLILAEYDPALLDWSPDGMQVVFAAPTNNNSELFLMDSDSSALHKINIDPPLLQISTPRWSPDGEWIAFMGWESSTWDIYRIRPDGSDFARLTENVRNMQWSPDGQWLLFDAVEVGYLNIFRIRPDGSLMENLTPGPGDDYSPQYAPVSGRDWHPLQMIVVMLVILSASMLGRFR